MPSTLIEIARDYSPAQETAIIDAVHDALVAAFKIPVEDKHLRLVVHALHRFVSNPGLDHPDRYTLVTIDCLPGRSLEAKRELYREIVARLAPFGIP
ncbi:MAG: tautomerase family protein, partial [Solirubrobacteraceae bacterium]|nr:tautomerase family protein [Solirubrobacteraceae bacterium]